MNFRLSERWTDFKKRMNCEHNELLEAAILFPLTAAISTLLWRYGFTFFEKPSVFLIGLTIFGYCTFVALYGWAKLHEHKIIHTIDGHIIPLLVIIFLILMIAASTTKSFRPVIIGAVITQVCSFWYILTSRTTHKTLLLHFIEYEIMSALFVGLLALFILIRNNL